MTRRIIYTSISLLLAVIIAALVGAFLSYLPKYYRLNHFGVQTQGTVISKEKENHQFIGVEYEVDNNKFKVKGNAEDFGKVFFTVNLNEKVPVTYNPYAPEESCLGNPEQQLNESIIGTCFVSTFPIIVFLVYLIRKKISQN